MKREGGVLQEGPSSQRLIALGVARYPRRMTRPLQIGFIGGGLNSAVGKTHRIAAELDGRWKLAAGFFSRDATINKATGEMWGVEKRTYPNLNTFLTEEAGKVDAVAVLTPTPAHYEQVSQLLSSGFNVVCEKALATTQKHARELSELAEASNRRLFVTFNYSGYPMVRELVARIRAGRFGDLISLRIEMPQEGYLRRNTSEQPTIPQQWRRKDYELPTVSLDLGVHVVQLANLLAGQTPKTLVALESHRGLVEDVVDQVQCLVRYTDDLDGVLWFGKVALGYRNGLQIRVFGTEGSAEWLQAEPETLRSAGPHGEILMEDRSAPNTLIANQDRYARFKVGHPAGFIEAFANLYVDYADAIVSGGVEGTWQTSVEQAIGGLAVLEAMNSSNRKGHWTAVPNESRVRGPKPPP